jgi:RNA polymerase sigma-70 factor (ECF subfamily)
MLFLMAVVEADHMNVRYPENSIRPLVFYLYLIYGFKMGFHDVKIADEPSDDKMIGRIITGEVNAFEPLMKKYKNHVLKIVMKHTPRQNAEEITQDVFVRAFQSLKTYKGKSGFKYWLSSIAIRTCYDFWRNAYRSREIPMSKLTETQQTWLENAIGDDSTLSFEETWSRKEAKEVLDWGLNQLSPEDRMVVELIYLEGLSGKEAAELLGWSLVNVKVRSHRSRKKLEKLLMGKRQKGII